MSAIAHHCVLASSLCGLPLGNGEHFPLSSRGVRLFLARIGYVIKNIPTGTGNGVAVEWASLPEETQIALIQRSHGIVPEDGPDAAAWAAYGRKSVVVQADAERAFAAMVQFEQLLADGLTIGEATAEVCRETGRSRPTIERMRAKIRDVPRANWLPALSGKYETCGRHRTDTSDEAWTYFLSLLKGSAARYTVAAAYRDTAKFAELLGCPWPSYATILGRWKEIPAGERALIKSGIRAHDKTIPPMVRTVAHLQAMQIVNLDGRQADFFVRWNDGTVSRPIVIAIQDVYSRMMLGWRFAKTEDSDTTKAVILDVIDRYGIFDELRTDNGRAFTSKKIAGGAGHSFRGKKTGNNPEEILGILAWIGCKFGTSKPRRGQSKPIERGFRDVAEQIDARFEFKGAYCGHRPDAKPEDFTGAPIAIDDAEAIYNRELREHNERAGRRTEMGKGKKSLETVFNESFKHRIRKCLTATQRRYFLCDRVFLKPNKDNGALTSKDFVWWSREHEDVLLQHRHGKVAVLFDPNDRSKPVMVLDTKGDLLIEALPCLEKGRFDSTEDARQHERAKAQIKKADQKALKARKLMTAAQLTAAQRRVDASRPPPAEPVSEINVTAPVFGAPGPKPKTAPKAKGGTVARFEQQPDVFESSVGRGLDIYERALKARRA
ncbi:MAG: transposase domain-containing protein [Gluconacetobacter sp.]